jgi:hypothetical protein
VAFDEVVSIAAAIVMLVGCAAVQEELELVARGERGFAPDPDESGLAGDALALYRFVWERTCRDSTPQQVWEAGVAMFAPAVAMSPARVGRSVDGLGLVDPLVSAPAVRQEAWKSARSECAVMLRLAAAELLAELGTGLTTTRYADALTCRVSEDALVEFVRSPQMGGSLAVLTDCRAAERAKELGSW